MDPGGECGPDAVAGMCVVTERGEGCYMSHFCRVLSDCGHVRRRRGKGGGVGQCARCVGVEGMREEKCGLVAVAGACVLTPCAAGCFMQPLSKLCANCGYGLVQDSGEQEVPVPSRMHQNAGVQAHCVTAVTLCCCLLCRFLTVLMVRLLNCVRET